MSKTSGLFISRSFLALQAVHLWKCLPNLAESYVNFTCAWEYWTCLPLLRFQVNERMNKWMNKVEKKSLNTPMLYDFTICCRAYSLGMKCQLSWPTKKHMNFQGERCSCLRKPQLMCLPSGKSLQTCSGCAKLSYIQHYSKREECVWLCRGWGQLSPGLCCTSQNFNENLPKAVIVVR